jgi:replicative DNA helicase
MTPETHIISQLLFYKELHHFLPKINHNWFADPFHQKLVKTLTGLYVNNEESDMVGLGKHLTRSEVVQMVQLQQMVSGLPKIENYLRVIEYEYIKTHFIKELGNVNTKLELPELVEHVQGLIDNTQFTTLKEPKAIIKETNKVVDQIADNISKGTKLTGKPTGWIALDKYLGGWNAGDVVVMAGRPGMGKTAIALTLIKDFAKAGGKGLFLSLEMSNEQLTRRYISLIGGVANWKIRNGNIKAHELEVLFQMANNQTINFFIDDDPECSIADIRGKVKLHKSKHGLELLVIDYIQLIKGTKQNREQEIAEISRNLKLIAKELGITVIVLAQLSRKSEERADKRPMLSDLRESGAIEQDADVVMFPFRPEYYKDDKPLIEDAELIIGKNRHGESVTVPVKFEGQLTSYTEAL